MSHDAETCGREQKKRNKSFDFIFFFIIIMFIKGSASPILAIIVVKLRVGKVFAKEKKLGLWVGRREEEKSLRSALG